ncbi:hypothetical protein CEXT_174111 [Caerostris extrusa]|uniref:Uncharacterized protein n=1 Tax=Caerostris extrusa TaxID=172846 RepID=A0AAV4S1J2_CAEEX|nr:hypothetical protein CEXT_174111 [Caerostris extrusa]
MLRGGGFRPSGGGASSVTLFRRWYDACNKHCTLNIPRDVKNTLDFFRRWKFFSGTFQEMVVTENRKEFVYRIIEYR